jgi:hypothetical protein
MLSIKAVSIALVMSDHKTLFYAFACQRAGWANARGSHALRARGPGFDSHTDQTGLTRAYITSRWVK